MKFGKHIQKRQLDIPEYAASFVDYKALKKLIKKLSATPILPALQTGADGELLHDSQASLQANKATFFFRLERELEKVNKFYLQKEAELELRLRTLLDKKTSLRSRATPNSKISSGYVTLEEGFRLFSTDLDKLQQFVEVNQTAFSKILKKWDKTSKSRTKELYLSRAVDVQPCFNRDIISNLSDQATTGLLDLQAWAEGERVSYASPTKPETRHVDAEYDFELENQVLQAINNDNISLAREWITRISTAEDAVERISSVFLATFNTSAPSTRRLLYETNMIDFNYADPINERNCLHEAAINGDVETLHIALPLSANIRAPDVYGRLPIHYACMYGKTEGIRVLIMAAPDTVDAKDVDNFTPLIHGIIRSQASSVETMLELGAQVNPTGDAEHTPLNLACQYGSVSIVQLILKYRPVLLPDAEGLFAQHIVARFGRDVRILDMLREYAVDMDQSDKLYAWTPIFHAASEGHLEVVQRLLEYRVDLRILDEKHLPAIYYAAWEGSLACMQCLAETEAQTNSTTQHAAHTGALPSRLPLISATPVPRSADAENIPSLSLPPPIVPLRRYGHNFLDNSKTFILLSIMNDKSDAIEFYGDNKYPAARLTISSKSSDLIPRHVPMPIQDDSRHISFQVENVQKFSVEFDVYPTFGSKVIARAAASSRVFNGQAGSTGFWHLELFDPRLRAIGCLTFRYHVITPFLGIPLEITHFATYWKATSQYENHPSNLITGSSLSGDFMRLFIQVTRDNIPVLFCSWSLPRSTNDIIPRLTYAEFVAATNQTNLGRPYVEDVIARGINKEELATIQSRISHSGISLAEALDVLPPELNLELHLCHPSKDDMADLQIDTSCDINAIADAILTVVFRHSRKLRESGTGPPRSFVFSSYSEDMCLALNWKQPNYPVLLCNDLGAFGRSRVMDRIDQIPVIKHCGRASIPVKESVRVAQANNFMGLICTSHLLKLVPSLVATIKEAGLVLIADYGSDEVPDPSIGDLAKGVDGMVLRNAVLRFKDNVE